jgi:hypothetical protein
VVKICSHLALLLVQLKIGPTSIESTAGLTIDIPVVADFSGNAAGVGEGYVAQTMFYRGMKIN